MNKPVKINEVEKVIRKRLKEELPNCKFAVRIRANAFNTFINVHLMSANFETFARPIDSWRFIDVPICFAPSCFLEPDAHPDFECNGLYLTPEAWNAFSKAVNITRSFKLGNTVYTNLYIGKPDQPFERLETEEHDS